MKQNKDWTDVMRSALQQTEAPPPARGWERLESALGTPVARTPRWRVLWPRFAAAAAAVLICVAAGELLWRSGPEQPFDGDAITSVVNGSTEAQPSFSAQTVEKPLTQEPLLAVAATRPIRHKTVAAVKSDAPQRPTEDVADLPQEPVGELPAKKTDSRQQHKPSQAKSPSRAQPVTRSVLPEEKFVAYRPAHKKASLSLFGGGAVTAGSSMGNPGYAVRQLFAETSTAPTVDAVAARRQQDYQEGTFRHRQPLSFGLTVRKQFAHGLSLESGVNYTLLLSEVTLPYATEDYSQKLQFIGVPLRLNWNFLDRRNFILYIGAGGMVEKCIQAKFGSTKIDEAGVQWSVSGAVGAEYRLGGLVGLYFEPEASYYFTRTGLRTARTDSPMTLTLRLGVRLSF